MIAPTSDAILAGILRRMIAECSDLEWSTCEVGDEGLLVADCSLRLSDAEADAIRRVQGAVTLDLPATYDKPHPTSYVWPVTKLGGGLVRWETDDTITYFNEATHRIVDGELVEL